jgi:probable DNA metabolism protein
MAPTPSPLKIGILRNAIDFDEFRRLARAFIGADVAPEFVHWSVADTDSGDLFETAIRQDENVGKRMESEVRSAGTSMPAAIGTPEPWTVPRTILTLAETAILHSDTQRFATLYRFLWRLRHMPALAHDLLDPDRHQLEDWARIVRRDMHKMTAFVRFRTVHDPGGTEPLHVAWFEPDHHIVQATAPFFQRRFAQMRWAILTPECSVQWDGKTLQFGPGGNRSDAPKADAGEALWLTYYSHIFNPARLKVKMMEREMPRRYWHNLPEAQLIAPLISQAPQRSATMIEQGPTEPVEKRTRQVATKDFDGQGATVQIEGQWQTIATPQSNKSCSASFRQSEAINAAETADDKGLAPNQMPIRLAPDDPASLASQRVGAECCRACPSGAAATQAVFGEGPVTARLMIVGEQPGDQEDLQGRPFVGPAGQLLDRALADLGWHRSLLYVTNAVKHFKYELRGKRRLHKTPAQMEADVCRGWLDAEIATIQPDAIIALGATAARSLMGRAVAVTRESGNWLPREDGIPVLIALHPSALLRMPHEDRERAYAQWTSDLSHAHSYATA